MAASTMTPPIPRVASLRDWRTQGEPAQTVVTCAVPAHVRPTAPRRFTFELSNGSVDRMRDRIAPDGWDFGAYKENPVVLWAHAHTQPPIGRSPRIGVVGGRLVADVEFPDPGVYAFADTLHNLVAAGFLRAASVGFTPTEYHYDTVREGYDIRRAELIEWSLVSVGAHPDALITPPVTSRAAPPELATWIAAVGAPRVRPPTVPTREPAYLERERRQRAEEARARAMWDGLRGLLDAHPERRPLVRMWDLSPDQLRAMPLDIRARLGLPLNYF